MNHISKHLRPCDRRGGLLFKMMLVLIAFFAVIALLWMLLLPRLVTAQIEEKTGFSTHLSSLYANPFTGSLELHGLTLENPSDFPERGFIDIDRIDIAYDLTSVFSPRIVLDNFAISIRQLTLITKRDGVSNIGEFNQRLRGRSAPKPNRPASPTMGGKQSQEGRRALLIRRFTIEFDQLTIANYAGPNPDKRTLPLRIDRTLMNLTDPRQVATPLANDIAAALLPNLASQMLNNFLGGGAGAAQKRAREAADSVKALIDSLELKQKAP